MMSPDFGTTKAYSLIFRKNIQRAHDIKLTLIRRHLCTKCPPGINLMQRFSVFIFFYCFYQGNNHIFEYNHIHHSCVNASDCGAFMTGRDWTTVSTYIIHPEDEK